ncbi:hypothetical protein Plec18170_005276 [Paecilomyces lecythidis]
MARLNDLAPPGESIEALKRRFIRQNRELARANSIQSLRIQALESEISRLLCQNATLHEQVISLNHEIERYESAKALSNGVYDLKERLDAKLAELGKLVVELGGLPRKVDRKTEFEAAASGVDEERQSHISHRRAEIGPDAIAGFDDGRLPPILEDKYYPRKTLDLEELEDMENDVPGSPELGPPPVAHLDPDDSPSPTREEWTEPFEYVKQTYPEPENDYKGALYSQQPRKRGRPRLQPAPVKDDKKSDLSGPSEGSRSGVKLGHKRKFDDEDLESHSLDAPESEDDFKFNRTSRASDKVRGHLVTQSPQQDVGQGEIPGDLKDQVRVRRRVLEPKSTNVNNGSPKKQRASASENKKDNLPEEGRRTARTNTSTKPRLIKQEDENSMPERYAFHKGKSGKADVDMDEKAEATSHTPAKFASPQLQNVSATTPNELEGSARPARRPRNVVSYVEPNLKAKMRRPTKEFITAVPEDLSRRTSNSRMSAGREEGETITPGLQMEDGRKSQTLPTDSVSQQEPGSPSPAERDQASISGSRKGSDRRRRTGRGESLSVAVEDTPQPELDTDSVPDLSTGKGPSTVIRQSRRHSSNPTGYYTRSGRDSSPDQAAEHLASTRSHRARRRGESAHELGEDDIVKGTRLKDVSESLERDDIESSSTKTTMSASNKALMEAELLRRGRASARRRSMMF